MHFKINFQHILISIKNESNMCNWLILIVWESPPFLLPLCNFINKSPRSLRYEISVDDNRNDNQNDPVTFWTVDEQRKKMKQSHTVKHIS